MGQLPKFDDHREHARAVVAAALEAADPAKALARHWDEELGQRATVVLAIGKASVPMAREALHRLGRQAVGGLVTAPPELADSQLFCRWPVRVMACDHPFPTQRNLAAAHAAKDLVGSCRDDQTLLILVSGGGSAHLTLPSPGLTIDDLAGVTKLLQRAGATITELNCVRKHCEELKGGRLTALSTAGQIRAMILSDVIGDRLDVIASGPTVPDPTSFGAALGVLARYDLIATTQAIERHLERGIAGSIPETPKDSNPCFSRVTNTIISSNRVVVKAVAAACERLGFKVMSVQEGVEGEARDVGRRFAERAGEAGGDDPPACFVLGGETTVSVGGGTGTGGPSQELALAGAISLGDSAAAWKGSRRVALVTFSTDGRDGPTDAAGAVVTSDTAGQSLRRGSDPRLGLQNHDSYSVLEGVGALIRTPPTGTNLNHIAALLVYPSD